MDSLFRRQPQKASAAILDDEVPVTSQLVLDLNTQTNIECHPLYSLKDFVTLIESGQIDAASVDWELKGYEQGQLALRTLVKEQPDVARIVYTKHEYSELRARASRTDFFLLKPPDGSTQEYVALMRRGVRLGQARRITRRLGELSEGNLPDISVGEAFDEAVEFAIYQRARKVAFEQLRRSAKDGELIVLLRDRGWWREFSLASYCAMSGREKMGMLAGSVIVDPSELAKILRCDVATAGGLLGVGGSIGSVADRNVLESADRLLAALGYVLDLADHEMELMEYYWTMKRFWSTSMNPPPWDELGMKEYLLARGPAGITESVMWIRSH